MVGWVVMMKRTPLSEMEIVGESKSERLAIRQADRCYSLDLADVVMVVECDTQTELYHSVYKRERKCKHTNVQFTLTTSGVQPVCCKCGLVMITNRMEVGANEER